MFFCLFGAYFSLLQCGVYVHYTLSQVSPTAEIPAKLLRINFFLFFDFHYYVTIEDNISLSALKESLCTRLADIFGELYVQC